MLNKQEALHGTLKPVLFALTDIMAGTHECTSQEAPSHVRRYRKWTMRPVKALPGHSWRSLYRVGSAERCAPAKPTGAGPTRHYLLSAVKKASSG